MPDIFYLLKTHVKHLDETLQSVKTKRIYNISISHLALFVLLREKTFIVIEDSEETASMLYNDLLFFKDTLSLIDHPSPIIYLPPPSDPEKIGQRARALYEVQKSGGHFSVVTSKEACLSGFNVSEIKNKVLNLQKCKEKAREKLELWLKENGYKGVSIVLEKGEYSPRGWLFDIYPTTEDLPIRVEFFGDEIELIRTFDIDTQRSIRELTTIEIFPAIEEPKNNLVHELACLFRSDVFIHDSEFPSLKTVLPEVQIVPFSHLSFIKEGLNAEEEVIKGLGITPEERKGIGDIPFVFANIEKNITAILPSNAQAERLKDILFDGGVIAPIVPPWELKRYDGRLSITTGRLSSGINLPKILILTDREIFGERPIQKAIKQSKISRLLASIEDLKAGDFVVHKDHGIGRFMGIQRQKTEDYEEDLIIIDYANGRLYVPLHGIEKIKKYSALEGHIPTLNKLGSKSWQKTKLKVKKGITEMAKKLLKLYAERKITKGFAFSEDTVLHKEFDDFFPYELTPDQAKAIDDVKKNMHSETPMEILLCGDAGYGKTEVATRAAFRAVYDGKQVAILVPTTLLAEQHFRTFKSRFSGFPVKIDYLSRFKSPADIKKTIKAIANGEIDIVIGTHMLLNKKVQFYDLGLLIIDEEHRFGVAQKERLKELKKGVDILTLTATPIPRTLHMSLSGIKEMCIIQTPPEERLAVKSIVTTFSADIIKEAIKRELERDGQVFFVHNRIKDIDKISDFIKNLIPEAKIAVAHGQMREAILEDIMLKFFNKDINVLVCTAIVGSGLDIPTANTIIVNRADTFGLSDLYQLRGRVGRGNKQAYAYFLIGTEDILTDDAKRRLQAVQEMSYLGAGFRLALKDLEIRGAGNLLGVEQSGHIYKVGFDMYMEMLQRAVSEIKGEEVKEEVDPQIRLRLSAFIPHDYIPDITLRLSIYRRISSVKTLDDLLELKDELIDRFGKIPYETENLMHVIKIKILSKLLYISKVYDIDGRYRFIFISDPDNKYKIPEDFFDRLLKTLFELQKREKGIRFFPDGFELDLSKMPLIDAIKKVEDNLEAIVKSLTF